MDTHRFDQEAVVRSIAMAQNVWVEWWIGGMAFQCIVLQAIAADAEKMTEWLPSPFYKKRTPA